MIRNSQFRAKELIKMYESPPDQHIGIGDAVILNSGGPSLLVVDLDEKTLTVSWRDDAGYAREHSLPKQCVTHLNYQVGAASI